MARYSQAEWRPFPSAGRFSGGPKRLVIHTTEGTSIAGAESAYRAKNVAPHFTVDPRIRRWVQHVDTSVSASAMRNDSGGVQTNRRSAIQVEIVGFAAHTQDMLDDDLEWLGRVLFAICWYEGIPMHVHPAFVGTEAGTIATASAPQRMSFAKWDAFHGVCGHQHVPENHHWDPGRFPYDRMMRLIQEDEMNGAQEAKLDDTLTAIRKTYAAVVKTYAATVKVFNEVGDLEVDPAEVARLVLADLETATLSDEQVRSIIDALPDAVKQALREGTG